MAPTPLAAIHSTQDDFVPLATVKGILDKAGEPKRLWVVKSSNHGFTDNFRDFDAALAEAMAWVATQAAGPAK